MGITGLLPLLKSIQKPCHLKKFSGYTIGVDAYGWLHRGTVSCAIDLALGRPTSKHVDFAMHRVRMLVHFGIKPYIVFDGDNLPSKAGTEMERAARRAESKRVGMELLKLGKTSLAHAELQKAVDVTPEMARQFIEHLRVENIAYVVAPYEADAQLAYLERKGVIQAILSEDSDLLVFGAKCLLTKLDQYGECVMISRSDFTACREVSFVGWSDAEFRRMAILSGCDYLVGIHRMGLKTAHRLIRKHKTLEKLLQAIQFDGQFKIPVGYLEAFRQAELTFLHHWVFCPLSNRLVNLTDIPSGSDPEDMAFLGPFVEAEIAAGVSRGDLHPQTRLLLTYHGPAMSTKVPPKKKTAATDLDVKKNRSIKDCFKPKRVPLAELDPNSFTPSPRQQELLLESSTPWFPRSTPAQHQRNISAPSFSRSAPSESRRSVSDSRRGTLHRNVHAPKRPRLCSDTEFAPSTAGATKVETGLSRFFGEESPSLSKGSGPSGKSAKQDFNLWSDDSIAEALSQFPDPIDCLTDRNKKKIAVFADEVPGSVGGSLSVIASEGPAAVRTTTITVVDESLVGVNMPDTSIETPPATVERTAVEFDAYLSAEIRNLRQRFSYQPPTAGRKEIESPRMEELSPVPQRSGTYQDQLTPTRPTSSQAPLSVGTVTQVPSSSQFLADDSAYTSPTSLGRAMLQTIPISPCNFGTAGNIALTPTPSRSSCPAHSRLDKGSEDFLVPDSEAEVSASEGEGLETPNPKFDLARFAFIDSGA